MGNFLGMGLVVVRLGGTSVEDKELASLVALPMKESSVEPSVRSTSMVEAPESSSIISVVGVISVAGVSESKIWFESSVIIFELSSFRKV